MSIKTSILTTIFFMLFGIFAKAQDKQGTKILTDELCDKLTLAAQNKSKELGVEISFAVTDEAGTLRLFRRFGDALPLSVTLVPGKAYTSSVTRAKTEDLTKLVSNGGNLYGINTSDPKITVVTGGYPLIVNGKVIGAIGVGGGTENQDREIGDYIVKIFQDSIKK